MAEVAARLHVLNQPVATVLAGSQLFRPGFSPGHAGAFGSVFIGFMAYYALHLLGVIAHQVGRRQRRRAPLPARVLHRRARRG